MKDLDELESAAKEVENIFKETAGVINVNNPITNKNTDIGTIPDKLKWLFLTPTKTESGIEIYKYELPFLYKDHLKPTDFQH